MPKDSQTVRADRALQLSLIGVNTRMEGNARQEPARDHGPPTGFTSPYRSLERSRPSSPPIRGGGFPR